MSCSDQTSCRDGATNAENRGAAAPLAPHPAPLFSEQELSRQLLYTEALARCSRALLNGSLGAEINYAVLNEALNHLVVGTGVARIGIFEAHDDRVAEPYTLLIAEGVLPPYPSKLAELRGVHIPTSPAIGKRLMAGEAVGITIRELNYTPAEQAQLDIRTWLFCPLHIDGLYWGNLAYGAAEDDRQWSEHEVMLLRTAAEMFSRTLQNWRAQAELSLRNAQLAERAQQVAVLEERQRLSRDLHDSVTQSLYSLVLLADGGQRLARAGRLDSSEAYLADLGGIALQSLKELRLLVYELRPSHFTQENLLDCLRQRLHAVEERAGVVSHLVVEGDVAFSPREQDAIWGIAQEALNNALKYASAKTVSIRLWADAHIRGMEIADDGRGFDVTQPAWTEGIGLSTMRERAAAVGGLLRIHSAPGAGTVVKVEIRT